MDNLPNKATQEDEAEERLVSNEEKNGHQSNDKKVEVKYVTPDSQNGDAKIDIANIKTAFAGMGKEELMKYANDPFWIKMRWLLFILFWLIWVAMLAGAIAIIVLAPKCSSPQPKEWWEQSPLYEISVPSFKDSSEPQDGIGDLKGLESKLDYLKDLGVKTVVLSSVLNSSPDINDFEDGNVIDYMEVDPRIGTLQQFRELAAAMKSKGLYLLMSFTPNHASDKHPWFLKSVKGEAPYSDYYVWAKPASYDQENGSKPLPPNNWLSTKDGSAWKWVEERKMFYLHQFGEHQPDFNFHNQQVVGHFKDVMKFWLDNGVSGFHLDKVQYLLEDKDLRDEDLGQETGAFLNEYNFLKHSRTSDLEELSSVLQQWNKIPANNSGILYVTSRRPEDDKITATIDVNSKEDSSVGQLFVRPQVLRDTLTADVLLGTINDELQRSTWPTWDFTCKANVNCITEDMLSGLQIVSLMLPGTPVTRSGSELGVLKVGLMPWDNTTNGGFSTNAKPWKAPNEDYAERNVEEELSDPNSNINVYKKLIQTRELPAITHGATVSRILNNKVLVFTRIKIGVPGILVAFNVQTNSTKVDLTSLPNVPSEFTIVASTADTSVNGTSLLNRSSKLQGDAVQMSGYSAYVLQFTPEKD